MPFSLLNHETFLLKLLPLVFLQRNSEVSLLACWPYTLNVEHWVLAGRSTLYSLLQVINRIDVVVVDALDDETA